MASYAILLEMGVTIAVDVGGTYIRAALYPDDHLKPIRLVRTNTRAPHSTPLEQLEKLITSIFPQDQKVDAISVAAPGPLNPYEGVIYKAPNVPGWKNLPLKKHLQERFQVPVFIGNDANLAALGEWRYGAGQGHSHLIYVTVSTGIGAGVIIENRLLLGNLGLAAELGHVTVLPEGPLCGCGQRGHLEAVASGPAIARWVEQELSRGHPSLLTGTENLDAKQVAQAAYAGDDLAIAALDRAGRFLGQALADFLHIFNPSLVIIGGGVSQSGDLLLSPMKKALHEHVMSPQYLSGLEIVQASLGEEVGLIGALTLARLQLGGLDYR